MVLAKAKAFPKEARLRNASDFETVYQKGERRSSRSFVVFIMPNGLAFSRFGLTTPKKLGKSHDRNRIKRRVREIVRTSKELMPSGIDVVVNPRRSVVDRPLEALRDEFLAMLGGTR